MGQLRDYEMRPAIERYELYRAPAPSWRIFRNWSGTKLFVGLVDAPDKVKAVELAIMAFQITNPDHQRHLVAELRDC
jgi:hypothetical protein